MFKVTTSGLPACTATHILQEKTHACGVLKRHNFRVHVSLGSAETLVRRGGIINHHSIAWWDVVSNISAKNYRNRLRWVESIVCNISVVFLRHSVEQEKWPSTLEQSQVNCADSPLLSSAFHLNVVKKLYYIIRDGCNRVLPKISENSNKIFI